ncbi:MAG: TonB family protein [Candidatus Solibacter sp.]|jgi:TonB family protein
METVGPPPEDVELHLLTDWGDPASRGRHGVAGVASVLFHVAGLLLIVLLPSNFLSSPPEPAKAAPLITPLVEPLTEFTQPTPTKGKITKEIDMAALQPRPTIQMPRGAPSTTQPMAQRPAAIPTPPQPPPVALPEPPKEAALKEPKLELPPANSAVPLPPPTVEKPKLTLENVGGPPPPVSQAQSKVAIPNTSVAEAIRQNSRAGGSSGGLMVGDPGAGSGGYGEGINLPPSPGAQGSALELKSDPMGVDFRPYLTQILATIRRNWYAVMPESVKLGRHGKVGLLFAIVKSGNVSKVTYAFQSGADALDKAAVAAISASNPFPPLPAEFKGDRVVLQLNFAYNVPKQ